MWLLVSGCHYWLHALSPWQLQQPAATVPLHANTHLHSLGQTRHRETEKLGCVCVCVSEYHASLHVCLSIRICMCVGVLCVCATSEKHSSLKTGASAFDVWVKLTLAVHFIDLETGSDQRAARREKHIMFVLSHSTVPVLKSRNARRRAQRGHAAWKLLNYSRGSIASISVECCVKWKRLEALSHLHCFTGKIK